MLQEILKKTFSNSPNTRHSLGKVIYEKIKVKDPKSAARFMQAYKTKNMEIISNDPRLPELISEAYQEFIKEIPTNE